MKLKINDDFKENFLLFLSSLEKEETGYYYPATQGLTSAGSKLTLGFSCFALKCMYILDAWDDLSTQKKTEWINLINSFQDNQINNLPKNSFIDKDYYSIIKKFDINTEAKRQAKKILNRNYKKKNVEIDEFIRAETKQAISSLHQVGFTNNLHYESDIIKTDSVTSYLNSLDWTKPWNSGAQFSGLCVFLETQDFRSSNYLKNKNELSTFSEELLSLETGCYFKGSIPSDSEIINGTMKILTGLDWLNIKVHLPDKLIDTCLRIAPSNKGCDLVDIVYILYICSKQTNYRKKEIVSYLDGLLESISKHYFVKEGGFSYYLNQSQIFYYGLRITKGEPVPDIHGSMLLLWALSMVNEMKENQDIKLRIIKP